MVQQKAMRDRAANRHYLFLFEGKTGVVTWCLQGSHRYLLGRDGGDIVPDIVLKSPLVSRIHGEFLCMDEEVFYVDRGSLNGTFFNGEKLQNTESGLRRNILLRQGDVLRIDGNDLRYPRPNGVLMLYWGPEGGKLRWYQHELLNQCEYVSEGKDGICFARERPGEGRPLFSLDRMRDRRVALCHRPDAGEPALLVNGMAVSETYVLKERDLIRFGRFIGVLMGGILYFSFLPKDPG